MAKNFTPGRWGLADLGSRALTDAYFFIYGSGARNPTALLIGDDRGMLVHTLGVLVGHTNPSLSASDPYICLLIILIWVLYSCLVGRYGGVGGLQ